MAPSKSARSKVVGGRRVATRKLPSTKTTPTRDIASEVDKYLDSAARTVIEKYPPGSIKYPDPPDIDHDQYELAWRDDVESLMESPPVWDWIVGESRRMRLSLDKAEATLMFREARFREAATEKMKKDGATTADLDSLPEYAPYHDAIEVHRRAELHRGVLRQQAMDTHKSIYDALLERRNAVSSFLHIRPVKDKTEATWLESLESTLTLQLFSNGFHDLLATKTRTASDAKMADKMNKNMFDEWCDVVRASRDLQESQSSVLDAIQAGKSRIDPNTPWSRYATNVKLDELPDNHLASVIEPRPEDVDPETGLPKGGGSRWMFALLHTKDEDGEADIEARALHYDLRNSFSVPSLKDIPHAPWLNRPLKSYNDPRTYDATVSRPGSLHPHAGPSGSLLEHVASALTTLGEEWYDSLADVGHDLRENYIVPLGRETTLNEVRGAMEALGDEERTLSMAQSSVMNILETKWETTESQAYDDVTKDQERLREALSDEPELTQRLGKEWEETATKVINSEMLNGQEMIWGVMGVIAQDEQEKELLKAEGEKLQASYKSRKKELTMARRGLNNLFKKHGYETPLPNSVDDLISTLTAPPAEEVTAEIVEEVSPSEGVTTAVNTPSTSAWTGEMPPESSFQKARAPSPGPGVGSGDSPHTVIEGPPTPRVSPMSLDSTDEPAASQVRVPPPEPEAPIAVSIETTPDAAPTATPTPRVVLPPVQELLTSVAIDQYYQEPLRPAGVDVLSAEEPSASAPPTIAEESVPSEPVTSEVNTEIGDGALQPGTAHASPMFRRVPWADDNAVSGPPAEALTPKALEPSRDAPETHAVPPMSWADECNEVAAMELSDEKPIPDKPHGRGASRPVSWVEEAADPSTPGMLTLKSQAPRKDSQYSPGFPSLSWADDSEEAARSELSESTTPSYTPDTPGSRALSWAEKSEQAATQSMHIPFDQTRAQPGYAQDAPSSQPVAWANHLRDRPREGRQSHRAAQPRVQKEWEARTDWRARTSTVPTPERGAHTPNRQGRVGAGYQASFGASDSRSGSVVSAGERENGGGLAGVAGSFSGSVRSGGEPGYRGGLALGGVTGSFEGGISEHHAGSEYAGEHLIEDTTTSTTPTTPTLLSSALSFALSGDSRPTTRPTSFSLSVAPSQPETEPEPQPEPEPEPGPRPEPIPYDHDLHNTAISIGSLHRRFAPQRRKSDSIMERRPAGWEFVPEVDYNA